MFSQELPAVEVTKGVTGASASALPLIQHCVMSLPAAARLLVACAALLLLCVQGSTTVPLVKAQGTSVFYTRHADPKCASPYYEWKTPRIFSAASTYVPLTINQCLSTSLGKVMFQCKLGANKFSLTKQTFATTDTSCATPLQTTSLSTTTIIEHEYVCQEDADRGGYLKIHCGEDSFQVANPTLLAPALYSNKYCSRIEAPKSRRAILNVCTPMRQGKKIDFFYKLTQMSSSSTEPLTLLMSKYAATDSTCSLRITSQPRLTYPAVPSTTPANPSCVADLVFKGFYYSNAPATAPSVRAAPPPVGLAYLHSVRYLDSQCATPYYEDISSVGVCIGTVASGTVTGYYKIRLGLFNGALSFDKLAYPATATGCPDSAIVSSQSTFNVPALTMGATATGACVQRSESQENGVVVSYYTRATITTTLPTFTVSGTRIDYYQTQSDCQSSPATAVTKSQVYAPNVCGPTWAKPNGGAGVNAWDKYATCSAGTVTRARFSSSACTSLLTDDNGWTDIVPPCSASGSTESNQQYVNIRCDSAGRPSPPPVAMPAVAAGTVPYKYYFLPSAFCSTSASLSASQVQTSIASGCLPDSPTTSNWVQWVVVAGTTTKTGTKTYYADSSCSSALTTPAPVTQDVAACSGASPVASPVASPSTGQYLVINTYSGATCTGAALGTSTFQLDLCTSVGNGMFAKFTVSGTTSWTQTIYTGATCTTVSSQTGITSALSSCAAVDGGAYLYATVTSTPPAAVTVTYDLTKGYIMMKQFGNGCTGSPYQVIVFSVSNCHRASMGSLYVKFTLTDTGWAQAFFSEKTCTSSATAPSGSLAMSGTTAATTTCSTGTIGASNYYVTYTYSAAVPTVALSSYLYTGGTVVTTYDYESSKTTDCQNLQGNYVKATANSRQLCSGYSEYSNSGTVTGYYDVKMTCAAGVGVPYQAYTSTCTSETIYAYNNGQYCYTCTGAAYTPQYRAGSTWTDGDCTSASSSGIIQAATCTST